MSRQISAEGLALLKQWEGLRLSAYPDSGGRWAIGYGHTAAEVHEGMTITQEQADAYLVQDVQVAADCVDDNVLVPLNDNQFACLTSFTYNVGIEAFKGSTLLRKLNANNYDAIPAELMKWTKVTKEGKMVNDPGLVNRRNAECGLWGKGQFVASQDVKPIDPKPMQTITTVSHIGIAAGSAGTVLAEGASQIQTFASASHIAFWLFLALGGAAICLKLYSIFKTRS